MITHQNWEETWDVSDLMLSFKAEIQYIISQIMSDNNVVTVLLRVRNIFFISAKNLKKLKVVIFRK